MYKNFNSGLNVNMTFLHFSWKEQQQMKSASITEGLKWFSSGIAPKTFLFATVLFQSSKTCFNICFGLKI